jgi:hypothetical protein
MTENTAKRLAEMTDEGVFERLATAILRRADSRFRSLVHPGVNAVGKTVKAPVDGITFVPGAHPPQMIAVHHTICAARDLTKKWLHDPATVKPRRRGARQEISSRRSRSSPKRESGRLILRLRSF